MEKKSKNFYFNDLMSSIKNMSPLDNDEKKLFQDLKKIDINDVSFLELNKTENNILLIQLKNDVIHNLKIKSKEQGVDYKNYITGILQKISTGEIRPTNS